MLTSHFRPHTHTAYYVDTVKSLATRFPQLELADAEALDQLKEEFMDFTLSPGDHPSVETYKSATAVWNRWTGLLDWTTGLEYWNGLNCCKKPFS